MNDKKTIISFFVPGEPKAQPRPRAFVKGKMKNYKQITEEDIRNLRASVYDPDTANNWKNMIALYSRQHCPRVPLTGAIRCDIDFFFKRPLRLCRRKDPDSAIRQKGKPDRDNLEKAVLDTLTNVGFWRDDCQVCCGEIRKLYHSKGGKPGAVFTIQEVEEEVSDA